MFGQKIPVVEYTHYNDVDIPNTYKATLYISNKSSIYRLRTSNIEHWAGKENPHPNAVFTKLDTIYDSYIKTDLEKKELFYYDRVMKYNFLISDRFNIKWIIADSTKQILGYKCNKATTNFRGRQWEVWFTPEIAMPFGPWKLYGLPGLILSAHDTSMRFNMIATAIHYEPNDILSKNFLKLKEAYNKSPITLQDFINKSDEITENSFKERSLEFSSGSIQMIEVPRSGEELIYEWEK